MDKSSDNDTDIATEPYKGPGKVVAGAGYMYLSHAISVAVGAVGFATVGAVAHKQTNTIKAWAARISESRTQSSGIKKGFATVVAWVSEIAEKAARAVVGWGQKITGTQLQDKTLGEERTAAAFFAAGFGAVFGYIASSIWAIFKGSHQGDRGRRQFERAQEEIKHQREANADLKKSNDRLHQELVEAETKWGKPSTHKDSSLATAAPAEHAVATHHADHSQHHSHTQHADKPHHQLHTQHESKHDGMIHAAKHEAAVTQ